VDAGKFTPKYAMQRGLIFGRSVMSVMNTCTLTTCSGSAPAAFRDLSITAITGVKERLSSDRRSGIIPPHKSS
jgi:hypothetical protein